MKSLLMVSPPVSELMTRTCSSSSSRSSRRDGGRALAGGGAGIQGAARVPHCTRPHATRAASHVADPRIGAVGCKNAVVAQGLVVGGVGACRQKAAGERGGRSSHACVGLHQAPTQPPLWEWVAGCAPWSPTQLELDGETFKSAVLDRRLERVHRHLWRARDWQMYGAAQSAAKRDRRTWEAAAQVPLQPPPPCHSPAGGGPFVPHSLTSHSGTMLYSSGRSSSTQPGPTAVTLRHSEQRGG